MDLVRSQIPRRRFDRAMSDSSSVSGLVNYTPRDRADERIRWNVAGWARRINILLFCSTALLPTLGIVGQQNDEKIR